MPERRRLAHCATHRVSRLSCASKGLCYCSGVRMIISMLVACAAVALVLACVTVDPLGSGFSVDDGNDEIASPLDLSIVLPAAPLEPLLVPSVSGSVFFDQRPLPSRLITAELFRPPRVRA